MMMCHIWQKCKSLRNCARIFWHGNSNYEKDYRQHKPTNIWVWYKFMFYFVTLSLEFTDIPVFLSKDEAGITIYVLLSSNPLKHPKPINVFLSFLVLYDFPTLSVAPKVIHFFWRCKCLKWVTNECSLLKQLGNIVTQHHWKQEEMARLFGLFSAMDQYTSSAVTIRT